MYVSREEPQVGFIYLAKTLGSSISVTGLVRMRLQRKPLVDSVNLLDIGISADAQDGVAVNSYVGDGHDCGQEIPTLGMRVSLMKANEMMMERAGFEVKEQTWASVVGTNAGKTYLGETTKDGGSERRE
jgi:hypothetical protein